MPRGGTRSRAPRRRASSSALEGVCARQPESSVRIAWVHVERGDVDVCVICYRETTRSILDISYLTHIHLPLTLLQFQIFVRLKFLFYQF